MANPLCKCGCGGIVLKPTDIYLFNHHTGNPDIVTTRERLLSQEQRIKHLSRQSDRILLNAYSQIIDKMVDDKLV